MKIAHEMRIEEKKINTQRRYIFHLIAVIDLF